MKVDRQTGWIDAVRRVDSPNHDTRPSGVSPDLVVIHGISLPPGEFGGSGIDELFCNVLDPTAHPYYGEICHLRVSSHVLITRDGKITQYVSFLDRAWHAGPSSYCGRTNCNDFAVGIELEGTDDMPYEPVQYRTLAALITALRSSFGSLEHAELVGHSDIAPGRKTDPGPYFDWDHLHQLLAAG
jgi:AmpD protein